MIEKLISIAESSDTDFVISGLYVDFIKDNSLYDSLKLDLEARIIQDLQANKDKIIDLFVKERINGPCAKLYKKSIIKENNIKMPVDIDLQEDLYFNIEYLSHISKIYITDEVYYHYIKDIDEISLTRRYIKNRYDMLNTVHNKVIEFYKDIDGIDEIYYLYIKNLYSGIINLFNPGCNMSRNDKLEFINRIISSNDFNYKIQYANKKGIKYFILKIILKSKNSKIIYLFGYIINIIRKNTKMTY